MSPTSRLLSVVLLLSLGPPPLHGQVGGKIGNDSPAGDKFSASEEGAGNLELVVPSKIEYKPGKFLRVKANTTAKKVAWVVRFIDPAGKTDVDVDTVPGDRELLIAMPLPQTQILVVAAANVDGQDVPSIAVVTMIVEGNGPRPPPTPGPNPPNPTPNPPNPTPNPPAPVPVVGVVKNATLLMDYDNLTQDLADLKDSAPLRAEAKKRGVTLRSLNVKSEGAKAVGFVPLYEAAKGPCLVLQADKGADGKAKVIQVFALTLKPNSKAENEAGIISLIDDVIKGK